MELKYIDTHCHLQFFSYDKDRFEVIERMKTEGVGGFVVGTNAEDSAEAVETTTLWGDGLWAIVGMHPHEAGVGIFDSAHYRALLQNDKVVGVGECGLDYYRFGEEDAEKKRAQRDLFETQIQLALEHNLPLMLHCRPSLKGSNGSKGSNGGMDAYEDVIDILRSYALEHGEKLRGNAHFFVGNVEIAKGFLDLGFTLSFPGIITFAREYDDAVKYAPLDMVLKETDAPFAAPEPHRGKINEPVYVKEVARKIAEIRLEEEEKVRQQLVENAKRVFDI